MDEDVGGLIWHFVMLEKESPSEGGSVRGAALSTEKQGSNLRGKLSCGSFVL